MYTIFQNHFSKYSVSNICVYTSLKFSQNFIQHQLIRKSKVSDMSTTRERERQTKIPNYVHLAMSQFIFLTSSSPLIEMCIPSSLDPTLAPPGCHVISLFTQYTPYHLKDGAWTDEKRNAYADKGRYNDYLPLSRFSHPCVHILSKQKLPK